MSARLRDYGFLLAWSLLTLGVGTIGLPALLSRKTAAWMSHFWVENTLILLRVICGVQSQVRGYINISATPVLYVAKHQSTWDTLMLWKLLGNPAFVLKRGLYFIPVFGWFLWRTGQISIVRSAGKKTIEQIMSQAQHYVAQGRSIVVFPEGTRTKPFAVTRYKIGVAHVSEAIGVPVIPVALNAGLVWPKKLVAKRSGTAVIEFLPAMPAAGKAKEPWVNDVATRIEFATSALLKQA